MSFPTCLYWIRSGTCNPNPIQAQGSHEQPQILSSHEQCIDQSTECDDIAVKYGLQNYDNDDDFNIDLTMTDDMNCANDEIDMLSDVADDVDAMRIDSTDSVLVAGFNNRDFPELIIYVYNPDKDYFYVHHDLPFLSTAPVALDLLETKGTETKYIVVAGYDGSLQFWNLDTINSVQPVKNIRKNRRALTSVIAIDSNCYTSNTAGQVLIWDVDQEKLTYDIQLHKSEVTSLDYIDNCSMLLSSSTDRTSVICDYRSMTNAVTINHESSVNCGRWDPWNANAFIISSEDTLSWIDIRNRSKFHSVKIANEDGLEFRLSRHIKSMAIVAGSLGRLYVFDDKNMLVNRDIKMGSVIDMAINPDHHFVCALTGDAMQKIKLKDLRTLTSVRRTYGVTG